MVYENVHVSNHPLVKHKLSLLRDEKTEHKKFRELIRELAILLGYEAMADLALEERPSRLPWRWLPLLPARRCRSCADFAGWLGMLDGILEMILARRCGTLVSTGTKKRCARYLTITNFPLSLPCRYV